MVVNGEDEAWTEEDEYGFRSPIEKGISLVARIFTGLVKIAKAIATPVLYIIGGILLFSILTAWLGMTGAGVFILPHVDFFTFGPDALGYLGIFNAVFALGIPLLVIVLSITKYIFKFKVNNAVTVSLIVFAVINFFSLASIVGSTAKDFKVETTQLSKLENSTLDTDTIHLTFPSTNDLDHDFIISLGDDARIVNDELFVPFVGVDVKRSENDQFSIDVNKTGRGNNTVAADDYLDYLNFDVKQNNGHIEIPQYYTIEKGGKFRAQKIEVTLNIPDGKHIVFGKGAHSGMIARSEMAEGFKRDFRTKNTVWQVTDKGIINNLTQDQLDKQEPHEVTISLSATKGIDIDVKKENKE